MSDDEGENFDANQMEGSDPFSLASDEEADVLVLDDKPGEVVRFGQMLGALGYSYQVLDRLTTIKESMAAVRSQEKVRPKLLAMDLWWDFRYRTFEPLGRGDVKVPKEEHLKGLAMLRDVLTQDAALKGVPSLLLSSFLNDFDKDYDRGVEAMRKRGVRVEAVAKPSLRDLGGLECVATALEKVGIAVTPTNSPAPLPVEPERLERALSVLANALEVSPNLVREYWTYGEGSVSTGVLFERARLGFKILLAAKTLYRGSAYDDVVDDLDSVVPGVGLRDSIIKSHAHSMRLLAAGLERRVGGPL